MKTTHTPGPWTTAGTLNGTQLIESKNGLSIAVLADLSDEANASLIAAAPELLEALKQAEQWLSAMMSTRSVLTEEALLDCQPSGIGLSTIRTAIAKAEGRPTP